MINRKVRKYRIIMAVCFLISIVLGLCMISVLNQSVHLSQRLNDHINYNNHIWKTVAEIDNTTAQNVQGLINQVIKTNQRLDDQCNQFSGDIFKLNQQTDNLTVMIMNVDRQRREMTAKIITWVKECVVFLLQRIDLCDDNHHGYNHRSCPTTH